jgi:hypothetical protein
VQGSKKASLCLPRILAGTALGLAYLLLHPIAIAAEENTSSPCGRFTNPENKRRCEQEFTPKSKANPYCLPPTISEMNQIGEGRRVVIPCVGGASQVYN